MSFDNYVCSTVTLLSIRFAPRRNRDPTTCVAHGSSLRGRDVVWWIENKIIQLVMNFILFTGETYRLI
jgi:hypothetical protein